MRVITRNPVQVYSGADAEKSGKAAALTAGIGLLGTLAATKLGQQPSELKQACGRKPLFKKKRGEYNECVKNFQAAKNLQSQQQIPVNNVSLDTTGKGLSKNWKIGLSVGGGLLVAAVIIYLFKRSKNKVKGK